MSTPPPNPATRFARQTPVTTWVGLAGTVLAAVLGAASGGFWMMLLLVSLLILISSLYGLLFRRRTWLRLPRSRYAAAIGVGIAFAAIIGSGGAYGAAHPSTPDTAPAVGASATASAVTRAPHVTKTPTARSTHSATPMPTPTHTPVVTTQLVTSTSGIPFTSTSVSDPNLAQGTKQVTTTGKNGVRTTTYRITYTDGKETGRTQISQQVTTAPVKQATRVGTYVAPAAAPGNGATARCNDGTYSYAAHHQGACSHHGGVAQFYK